MLSFNADGTLGAVSQLIFSTSNGSCGGTLLLVSSIEYSIDFLGTVAPTDNFSTFTPFAINLTILGTIATPQTAGEATSLNAESAGAGQCGFNGWANGVDKNISNLSCSYLSRYNAGYQEFMTYWIGGTAGSYVIHHDTQGQGACSGLNDIVDASHRCTHEDSNAGDAYTEL